jgi:hypothetical protein
MILLKIVCILVGACISLVLAGAAAIIVVTRSGKRRRAGLNWLRRLGEEGASAAVHGFLFAFVVGAVIALAFGGAREFTR